MEIRDREKAEAEQRQSSGRAKTEEEQRQSTGKAARSTDRAEERLWSSSMICLISLNHNVACLLMTAFCTMKFKF